MVMQPCVASRACTHACVDALRRYSAASRNRHCMIACNLRLTSSVHIHIYIYIYIYIYICMLAIYSTAREP
jgi:hypothetical protein